MERLRNKDVQALLEFFREGYFTRDKNFPQRVISRLAKITPAEKVSRGRPHSRKQVAVSSFAASYPRKPVVSSRAYESPLTIHGRKNSKPTAVNFSAHDTVPESYGRMNTNREIRRHILDQLALRQQAGDLNERGQAIFKLLNTTIAQGYRNALRLEQKAVVVEHALDRLHLGIIILSPLGKVRVITQAALQQVQTYFDDSAFRGKCLPTPLSKWVKAQEIASAEDETESPAERRELILQHSGGRLVIRVLVSADETVLLLEEHPPKTQAEPHVTSPLSPRQVDVVTWLSQGKTNNEIGLILKLSPRTVQKHLEHIYRKLGVENRTGAAARAYELGWTASKQNFFFVPICSLISQLYGLF